MNDSASITADLANSAHRDCAHHTPFDATEMAGVVARKGFAVVPGWARRF
jgi:hypothetical protein